MSTLVAAFCSVVLSAAGDAAGRPNVVMIISDDHAYTDFGFMGNTLVRTPHLDRLAARSARYANAYVPSSVCRPSLATLLTGLYPHEHLIHFSHPPPGNAALGRMAHDEYYAARARGEELIGRVPSLPRILASAGYDCLQTGKFWEGHYRNAGFTHGMTTGRAAGVPGCWDKQLPDGTTVAHGNGDAGLVIGRTTMEPLWDFIDEHDAVGDRPFFIWYAPVMPHEPHDPPQEYLALYRDDPQVPRHRVAYYAMCTWFDATVGQLIERLEEKGLARNTLFVFLADNGWAPSPKPNPREPVYPVDGRSKRSPFERGLRTPLLIRWDGRLKPATHDAPISSVDVAPTILDALGMGEKAEGMSGVSLMPSATGQVAAHGDCLDFRGHGGCPDFRGEVRENGSVPFGGQGDRHIFQAETARKMSQSPADRPVFGEIYPGDATTLGNPAGDVAYRWVRQGRLKLIVPHAHGGKNPWGDYLNEAALYDVAADPEEENDLSGDPRFAGEAARLHAILDAWWPVEPDDDPHLE